MVRVKCTLARIIGTGVEIILLHKWKEVTEISDFFFCGMRESLFKMLSTCIITECKQL